MAKISGGGKKTERMGNCFNETDLCIFKMGYCLCLAVFNPILI